jgi:hypothetical protein
MTAHALFGIAAGVLSIWAYPIYIADILRGNTKPSRITWWVLTLSNSMIAISYFASGARDTIWIPVSYSVGFFVIALFSVKYGEGGWSRLDIFSVSGVVASALLWYVFNSPEIALLAVVLVEFFGLVPTIAKTYRQPSSESRLAWTIATVASLLNIFAIESWTIAVATYPFYVFITNGLVAYLSSRNRV